jgi:hypothetical protein
MTIEHNDVEQVLGPLRDAHPRSSCSLAITDIPQNLVSASHDAPVREWIGGTSPKDFIRSIALMRR